jgi:DNA polymerase (family 10)
MSAPRCAGGGAPAPKRQPADAAAAAARLARAIDFGPKGAELARALVAKGVRTRRALIASPLFARLPIEVRANLKYKPRHRIPIALATAMAEEIARRLVASPPHGRVAFEALPVGSIRRQDKRFVSDIDILVVLPNSKPVERFLDSVHLRPARRGDIVTLGDVYSAGERRRSFIVQVAAAKPTLAAAKSAANRTRSYRCDIFLATAAERPFALMHYTGSVGYNIRTRAVAKRNGWLLNQYGLFEVASGARVRGSDTIRTEQDLAKFLGVTHRPPSGRS